MRLASLVSIRGTSARAPDCSRRRPVIQAALPPAHGPAAPSCGCRSRLCAVQCFGTWRLCLSLDKLHHGLSRRVITQWACANGRCSRVQQGQRFRVQLAGFQHKDADVELQLVDQCTSTMSSAPRLQARVMRGAKRVHRWPRSHAAAFSSSSAVSFQLGVKGRQKGGR
jgi:hypothetical protein